MGTCVVCGAKVEAGRVLCGRPECKIKRRQFIVRRWRIEHKEEYREYQRKYRMA